ncbi:OmpA family protein [Myroides indicus]|uniref:WD40 repeat protein n=1 Tax=Myroides indicus TaxID=1323422 RepID=A0A4R7F648_9FLAO|nr:OmpA family protein [Myroides indicus]TDS65268.1 WD40 repeat protein [Myroides indicus]
MRKTITKFFSLALVLCAVNTGLAQTAKTNKADKKFEKYEYVDAIEVYKNIAEKGYKSMNTLQKLADAYYFNGKLSEANKWYGELFEFAAENNEQLPSEYYYRYAQTLKAIEDYEKADQYMEIFSKMEGDDSRSKLFEQNKGNYLKEIEANSNRYEAEPLSINSGFSDYGAAIWRDNLVFASARQTEEVGKSKIHKWTNEAFTNLYLSKINPDGTIDEPVLFPIEAQNRINEASASFSADGKTVYFTQNNTDIKKNKKDEYKNVLLKIYRASLQTDGTWGNVVELPFNSNEFNTAHPALTPDGKWLYFASDRQGTLGLSDIFRVKIYENGEYGIPENIGNKINTEGRETFPFVSKDHYLYFSSDGRPGLGGLDIYMAKLNVDGTFGQVVNMGKPLNSSYDDFSFYIDPAAKKGFLSSNRPADTAGDNIYFFQEKKEIVCQQMISGYVFDKSTNEAIAQAKITVYNAVYNEITTLLSDEQGRFTVENLGCGKKYRLKAEAESYNTAEVSTVMGNEIDGVVNVEIGLDPSQEKIGKDDDLFKKLQLDPIYFDFDKSNIRPDAAVELAKVVEVLKMYPDIKIDVRSHTDSRGNDNYNMKLSDRRAKATMKWMIDNGISKDRITGKGYGESQLVNKCANGVPCTPQEHQANRRSEFIVVEM